MSRPETAIVRSRTFNRAGAAIGAASALALLLSCAHRVYRAPLEPGGTGILAGTVMLDPASGITRATLKLRQVEPKASAPEGVIRALLSLSDREAFRFDHLPAGEYDLVVEAERHTTYVERLRIFPGETARREIALQPAAFLPREGAATRTILCSACHKSFYQEQIRGSGAEFATGPWPGPDGRLIALPDHLDFYPNSSPEHLAYVSPIFQAALARQSPEERERCAGCHAPDLVLESEKGRAPRARSENRQDGVSCAVCHLDAAGTIHGKHDVSAPHPTTADERFAPARSFGLCAACHQADEMAPEYQTVAEWRRDFRPNDPRGCADCHLPAVTRRFSEIFSDRPERATGAHLFAGGHSLEMLRQAARVEIAPVAESGRILTIDLANTGAGHSLPTGYGGRAVLVRARVTDRQDRPVPFLSDSGVAAVYAVDARDRGGLGTRLRPALRAGHRDVIVLSTVGLPRGTYHLTVQLAYDLDRRESYNDADLPVIAEAGTDFKVP